MPKKTMTTDKALSIISEVITFYLEIRGKVDDQDELKWRAEVINAEHFINEKLNKQLKEVA